MPYLAYAFLAIFIFSLVHLYGRWAFWLTPLWQGRFLSAGGGIAIAYVFVDLLPKLCENDIIVQNARYGIFLYFERHVYIIALLGFLLFFAVDKAQSIQRQKESFWLSFNSYAIFNFFVGYSIVDKNNPEVRPLALFTFAMALHYFVNDFSMVRAHPKEYGFLERIFLVFSLFLGGIIGVFFTLLPPAVALASAFIAGGVIMNVTRHELPENNPNSLGAFLLGAIFYTIILLLPKWR